MEHWLSIYSLQAESLCDTVHCPANGPRVEETGLHSSLLAPDLCVGLGLLHRLLFGVFVVHTRTQSILGPLCLSRSIKLKRNYEREVGGCVRHYGGRGF
jgi:hypothetical protein